MSAVRINWLIPSRDAERCRSTVAQCIALIGVLKLSLAIAGPGRTLRWVRNRTAHCPRTASTSGMVEALEYTVAMAAALYPGRAHCLERSVVLFYVARRTGIAVTYHHGVQPLPFKAHAWVEYNGRVINDVPEAVSTYQPFPPIFA